MEERPTPLHGVQVIETGDIRGETCARLLADLGANVIKVEPAGGCASRSEPPLHEGISLAFAVRNEGKQSVVIDLESVSGQERLLALLGGADVWVDTGVLP